MLGGSPRLLLHGICLDRLTLLATHRRICHSKGQQVSPVNYARKLLIVVRLEIDVGICPFRPSVHDRNLGRLIAERASRLRLYFVVGQSVCAARNAGATSHEGKYGCD
jgi:hypothetical protein